MDDVETENKRNVKARLLDSDALKGVGFLGSDDIEERTDLSFRQHIDVVGASSAGTGGLACRVLNKLADLFFEGHFSQEFLDARFDGGIVPFGSGLNRCVRRGWRGLC